MYQAIQTKFLGPTNTRGARVKATADAGSVTIAWDHRLGIFENHEAAAVALARRYGWPEDMVGGGLPKRGYAFVRREPATAAPDMLAALRDLLAGMEQHGAEKWMPHRMERARAAVTKAEDPTP